MTRDMGGTNQKMLKNTKIAFVRNSVWLHKSNLFRSKGSKSILLVRLSITLVECNIFVLSTCYITKKNQCRLYVVKSCPKKAEKKTNLIRTAYRYFLLSYEIAERSYPSWPLRTHSMTTLEKNMSHFPDIYMRYLRLQHLLHHFDIGSYVQKVKKKMKRGPRSGFFFVLLLTNMRAQCGKLVQIIWDLKF